MRKYTLAAVLLIAMGIVGYGLVICFLLLRAPDLAIVQIVVETITLVIMVAVVLIPRPWAASWTVIAKIAGTENNSIDCIRVRFCIAPSYVK